MNQALYAHMNNKRKMKKKYTIKKKKKEDTARRFHKLLEQRGVWASMRM
jgi:hypothetical protein